MGWGTELGKVQDSDGTAGDPGSQAGQVLKCEGVQSKRARLVLQLAAGSVLRAVENLELKALTSDPIITSDPFTTSPHCDSYPLLLSETRCLLTMCPHKAFRAGGGASSPRR